MLTDEQIRQDATRHTIEYGATGNNGHNRLDGFHDGYIHGANVTRSILEPQIPRWISVEEPFIKPKKPVFICIYHYGKQVVPAEAVVWSETLKKWCWFLTGKEMLEDIRYYQHLPNTPLSSLPNPNK